MGGRAAQMAAAEVKKQLLERAATELEVAADDLRSAGGRHLGEGRARLSHHHGAGRDRAQEGASRRASRRIRHLPAQPSPIRLPRTSSQVKVDTETGQIEVLQVIPVHEIGKVIHPIAAAGQIEGGIQQGIGHTLTEDYIVDLTTGRSLNAELRRLQDAAVDGHAADQDHHPGDGARTGGPFGAKGVGEDPIIAIGPAIANAVHDAIGVRFHHYPITPEDVLKALKEKSGAPPPLTLPHAGEGAGQGPRE